jgi:hypothetical protein
MITEKMITDKFKWSCVDESWETPLYVARSTDNILLFVYTDKHGIANVFRNMGQYANSVMGVECVRACVENDERTDLQEGVDFIDAWIYENIDKAATSKSWLEFLKNDD